MDDKKKNMATIDNVQNVHVHLQNQSDICGHVVSLSAWAPRGGVGGGGVL